MAQSPMAAELRWYYQSSDSDTGISSNYKDGFLGGGDSILGPTASECAAAKRGAVVRRALMSLSLRDRNILRCAYSSKRVRPELRSRYGDSGGALVEALLRSAPDARKGYKSSQIRKMVSELLDQAHGRYREARGGFCGDREGRRRRIRDRVEAFVREVDGCRHYMAT